MTKNTSLCPATLSLFGARLAGPNGTPRPMNKPNEQQDLNPLLFDLRKFGSQDLGLFY